MYYHEGTGDFVWLTRARSVLNVMQDFAVLKRICIAQKAMADPTVVDLGLINEDVK